MNTKICVVPRCGEMARFGWEGCKAHMDLFWSRNTDHLGWTKFISEIYKAETDPLTMIWPMMR